MNTEEDLYTLAAVLSDLHIKKRTWNNWVKLKGDAQAALIRCIQLVRHSQHPVDLCILAGDIFDTNMATSSDLLMLGAFLSCFKRTLYIRGNHDTVVPSYLQALPNTQDVSATPYIDPCEKFAVYGIPYIHSRQELLNKLAQIAQTIEGLKKTHPQCQIYLLLHQAFQHLLGIQGMWQVTAQDIQDLLGGDVHVICGHIHKNKQLALSGTGSIYSPGSLYPLDWGQTSQQHCLSLLTLETGQILRQNIAVRDFVTLEGFPEGYDIISALRGLSEQNNKVLPVAVRIKLALGQAAPDPSQIPQGVVLQIITASQDQPDDQSSGVVMTDAISILDAVLLDLRQNNPDSYQDIYDIALNLYNSDDPGGYLDQLLTAWKCFTKPHQRRADAATGKNNAKKRVSTC